VSVLPLGDEGACAFARVSYGRLASVARATLFAVLVLATTGGMLLSAIGTYGLVVRPLHRRIASLAAAARAVGTSAFAAQPESADALGSIAEVLTETDMRVKQHRDALEQRNVALADHLAGIAHDLRTPLASLHLALESLSASAAQHSSPRRHVRCPTSSTSPRWSRTSTRPRACDTTRTFARVWSTSGL
jgi:signal transduction histidine kinase